MMIGNRKRKAGRKRTEASIASVHSVMQISSEMTMKTKKSKTSNPRIINPYPNHYTALGG